MPDSSYGPGVYRKQGGNEQVITALGTMTYEAGATRVRPAQTYFFIAGAKVGATAGWVVAAAANRPGFTCPASQTASTLVIPINGLHVGDTITSFAVIAQIESAGGTVTLDADLRKMTTVAADLSDASVGAITQVSAVADTALSATNAGKTGLTEVLGADESLYVLITVTTAASTDIDLQGVTITVTQS